MTLAISIFDSRRPTLAALRSPRGLLSPDRPSAVCSVVPTNPATYSPRVESHLVQTMEPFINLQNEHFPLFTQKRIKNLTIDGPLDHHDPRFQIN